MIKGFVHIYRFFLFGLIQIFLFNQLELGWGILPMAYPLVIFLLPVEMEVTLVLIVSVLLGGTIDLFSNTFGLHTSALLVFAYLRPWILRKFAPREEYESNVEINWFNMGLSWFATTFGVLLLIHHLWFFLFEVADLVEILYILQKTILSAIGSFLVCLGMQIIFIQKPKER